MLEHLGTRENAMDHHGTRLERPYVLIWWRGEVMGKRFGLAQELLMGQIQERENTRRNPFGSGGKRVYQGTNEAMKGTNNGRENEHGGTNEF